MRKLSADYIFTSASQPLKRGILILDDDGTVLDILDTDGKLEEMPNLEFYNGILVPGFVNCHSHLDFSWAANSIPLHTGLHGFIRRMISVRRNMPDEIIDSCQDADRLMFLNGISVVADICSSSELNDLKSKSPIQYVNLIEVLDIGYNPREIFDHAVKLINESVSNGIPAYLSPHAPYTVSSSLFSLVHSAMLSSVYSIHNQESENENLWFRGEKNPLTETFSGFQLHPDPLLVKGQSSLQTIAGYFPPDSNILLIHNIATSKMDIEFVEKLSSYVYWVMCPNSNLYINNLLPDLSLFRFENCKISLGTDGLGSNASLSIFDEILTIHSFFPEIPFEELIRWATINGAKALKLDSKFGSFERGKNPGVNLLQNFDLHQLKPSPSASLKRLV